MRKTIASILVLLLASSAASANDLEDKIKKIPHQDASQSIESYQSPIEQYLHATAYNTYHCTDPHTSALVNLTAIGVQNYGPPYDEEYLDRQIEVKNCQKIATNLRFKLTNAFPVYIGGFGAEWIAGIVEPKGSIIGYIPVRLTALIPIPKI